MKTPNTLALLAVMTVPCSMAMADDNAQITDSGMNSRGVLSVNQAAGNSNQQANQRALAHADQGMANVNIQALQSQESGIDSGSAHQASINGAAFSNSNGLIGVNQTAGYGNAANNAVGIAQGQSTHIQLASESLLADTSGGATATPSPTPQQNSTTLSPTAFGGSSGVVQLNQMAGKLNQSLNALAIRIEAP